MTEVLSNLSTASAVHRTFAVEELQYSIFSHLLVFFPWSSKPENRQDDLVAVAQTCQSFLEVTLNILYDRTTLHRLLRFWHGRGILKLVDRPSTSTKEIAFDRIPNAAEYQRLAFYSHRVRTLDVPRPSWNFPGSRPLVHHFSADFFPTLTEVMAIQSTAGHNLFPELRSLVWSCEREADFVGCEAIIQASPRLKAFACEESRKEAPERTWPTLFRTLASVQSLEILELQARNLGPIGPGSRTGLALSYLLSKPNIRQLLLPDQVVTSTLVMISLASARQLEKLTLVESTPSIADGSAVHCTVSSDRLSHLSGTPQSLRSILAGESGLKALTKLSIIYPWISFTWSFVRQFVDLIEKGCPILETLELEGRIDDAANLETHGIRAGFAIAGLGACTRMRRFHMDIKSNGWSTSPVPRDFNPSDSDWRCLTSQWPELQEMWYDLGRESLNDEEYKPALDPAPRATINTLTAFSRSCRQLKSLAVPMSATIHDTRAALQDDILPFSDSMDRMYFFRASIEDDAVEELAMLLLRLTRDDVELYPTELDDPDSTEGDELDSSREMNWHAAKKLVHFTRRARPLGAQASAS